MLIEVDGPYQLLIMFELGAIARLNVLIECSPQGSGEALQLSFQWGDKLL